MTKSKQNIYGVWAIEIYSMIWVLSKYERGQMYDLPEEDTSQLTQNNNNNNDNKNNDNKRKEKKS